MKPTIKYTDFIGSKLVKQQTINFSQLSSPRATEAKTKEFQISAVVQSLFGRHLINLTEVVMHILFKCNFATLCNLRLVSHDFRNLISLGCELKKGYSCSPLMDKAVVNFEYRELYPIPQQQDEKNLFLHQEKMQSSITMNVIQFLETLKIQNIEEEQINLNFEKSDEIDLFIKYLKSNTTKPIFLDKIKELNFRNIKIYKEITDLDRLRHECLLQENKDQIAFLNASYQLLGTPLRIDSLPENNTGKIAFYELLTIISNKMDSFSKFRSLRIGKFLVNERLFLVNEQIFKNITHLTIEEIILNDTLILPKSLSNLTNLVIRGYISKLELPSNLDKLTDFTIDASSFEACIEIPTFIQNLTSLAIKSLIDNQCIELTFSEEIINLTITKVSNNYVYSLTRLNSRSPLSGLLANDEIDLCTLKLPSLSNLTKISIKNSEKSSTANQLLKAILIAIMPVLPYALPLLFIFLLDFVLEKFIGIHPKPAQKIIYL